MRHLLACASFAACVTGSAGAAPFPGCAGDAQTLPALAQQLLCALEQLSDYRSADVQLPSISQVPQHEIEVRVCDTPCNVSAAYIPREGIVIAAHLEPLRSLSDRAALLHELIHHVQQGHAKFAGVTGCARERAKEEEAYALQNAYLAAHGSEERVRFPASEFDC